MSNTKPPKMENIELRHDGRPYHEIENELMLQGLTDKQIAVAFDASVASLKKYRKRAGYKPVRTLVQLDR